MSVNEAFDSGVQHTVELLAKWLKVDKFEMADGSEDYDTDLGNTLLNILEGKGLYNRDEACTVADPRPIAEYHEDMGPVLWWKFPIEEPPYAGSPNDLGFEVIIQPSITLHIATGEAEEKDDPSSDDLTSKPHKFFVGGWPGYHTHFTMIPIPTVPK